MYRDSLFSDAVMLKNPIVTTKKTTRIRMRITVNTAALFMKVQRFMIALYLLLILALI
jgi:CYTH domain-containing protein